MKINNFLKISSFIFIALFLLSACGNKDITKEEKQEGKFSSSPDSNTYDVSDLDRIKDEEIRKIIEDSQKEVKPRITSIYKINNEEDSGKIDRKKAVELRLKAVLDPEKLDEAYQGDDEIKGRTTLNQDIKWVLNNWENLSEDEKEEFKPYVTMSYLEEEDDGKVGLFIKEAKAAKTSWDFIKTSDNKVKIFFKKGDLKQKKLAQYSKEAVEKAWPMYKNLLGVEPDEIVEIFIKPLKKAYGAAGMAEYVGHYEFCEIEIGNRFKESVTKSTVVHELFHCFQYYLSDKYKEDSDDITWLSEASAVWSENYVYPSHDTEHEYIIKFFKNLDGERIQADGKWEYSNYPWFLFLSQYFGNDKQVVDTLKAIDLWGPREAVMQGASDYKNIYQEYAFYNWNSRVLYGYEDASSSFPIYHPWGKARDTYLKYDESEEEEYNIDLDKGAMKYDMFAFDPEKGAKYATFELDDHAPNITVTALVKTFNNWLKYDWDDVKKKDFCLSDEEIDIILLIIANSDQENKDNFSYKMKVEKECPKVSRGTMILKEITSSEIAKSNITMKSDDILEYDEESGCYDIVERSITCQLSRSSEAMKGTPAYLKVTENGQGSLTETYYEDEDRPTRICFDGSGATFILDPDTRDSSYVDVVHTMTANPARTEKSYCSGYWPTNHTVNPDHVKDDSISGQATVPVASMLSSGEVQIEYNYTFK